VFSSNRTRVNNLYAKSTSGAGGEELLLDTALNKQPQDWTKHGGFLLYYEIGPTTGRDLWALDMTGDKLTPKVVANSMFEERAGQFSPDGRWVAYETNESGRFEVVVQSFPEPRGRWPVSTSGGTQPRWSGDGREIYFMALDEKLMAASIVSRQGRSDGTGFTLEVGKPTALFPLHMATGGSATHVKAQYDVSDDGRFLVNEPVEESTTVPITLIVHRRP
jgi:Tol biopolymer transport system component